MAICMSSASTGLTPGAPCFCQLLQWVHPCRALPLPERKFHFSGQLYFLHNYFLHLSQIFFFFFNNNRRNVSIPSMFPFLALSCYDLLDAVKQRSLAGKPKAGQWADDSGGWDLSERRHSCYGAPHTLRVLATFWFEKGLQSLNYWEPRGNRL